MLICWPVNCCQLTASFFSVVKYWQECPWVVLKWAACNFYCIRGLITWQPWQIWPWLPSPHRAQRTQCPHKRRWEIWVLSSSEATRSSLCYWAKGSEYRRRLGEPEQSVLEEACNKHARRHHLSGAFLGVTNTMKLISFVLGLTIIWHDVL